MTFQTLISQLDGVKTSLEGRVRGSGHGTRTEPLTKPVPGGVDFSQAERQADGRMCVVREEEVETVESRPVLACSHREEQQCHQTYVTFFTATQEEECRDTFEKKCQITFRSQAVSQSVRSCRRPLVSVCDGSGPERCREERETSCSTRPGPGGALPETRCESVPVSVCGRGCVTREEEEEECTEREVDSLTEIPEEECHLVPQQSCRPVTRLVPSLRPTQECGPVPREVCALRPGQQRLVMRPLVTEWCLEPGLQALQAPSYDSV